MNKTFSTRIIALLVTLIASIGVMMAQTPRITGYYPAATNTDYPEIAASCYVYFSTQNVISAQAEVWQNGENLGTITYKVKSSAVIKNSAMMDSSQPENIEALSQMTTGIVTIKFFSITYKDSVQGEVTLEDYYLGEVNYSYFGEPGTVVAEQNFKNNTLISYVEPYSDCNIASFTFSKPIDTDKARIHIEYGYGDNMHGIDVPFTTNDDQTEINIDLRGRLLNHNVLAPGVTFIDEQGNPLPHPTTITMEITSLYCLDGSKLEYTVTNGNRTVTLNNRVFKAYDYLDLTFDNPEISIVKFFNRATPATLSEKMTAQTDMMQITIDNMSVIDSGDVVLTYGPIIETISDYTRKGNVITLAIPASIQALGSDALVVSMDNVVYNIVDGVTDHYVIPYDFATRPVETLSLAEVIALEEGTRFALSTTSGLKVTFSSDMGYMFVEDETAGVQVFPENDEAYLEQSTKLIGRIIGTYHGGSLIEIDNEKSNFTASYANVETGTIFDGDITELLSSDAYYNRLVTIMAGDDLPIMVMDEEIILVGDGLPAVTGYIEGYEMPEDDIANITGILYYDPSNPAPMLIIRSSNDINREISNFTSIADLKQLAPMTPFEVFVKDVKVTVTNQERGYAVIEDKNAAIQVYTDEELTFPYGYKFTGKIKGIAYYNALIINFSDCEVDLEKTDVTFGTMLSIEECKDPDNLYRLVTFKNTPETPIVVDGFGIYVGNDILVCDYMDILGDDFDAFPQHIDTVTGFLFKWDISALNDDDGLLEPEPNNFTYVSLRSINDIIEAQVVEGDVNGDGEIGVSDVTNLIDTLLNDIDNPAADVNGDGQVTVTDVTALINLILN